MDEWTLSEDVAKRLMAIVGSEHVEVNRDRLAAEEQATFSTTAPYLARVRPSDRQQIADCLRVADEERIPVYPVSRGRNWGLGSRAAVQGPSIQLDLARMTRIVDYDSQLGCLTVEPGVTFQQAYDFLTEKNAPWILPVTGGPPDGSIVGNTVERGDGVGPYGDRLQNVCDLEVVLTDGSIVPLGMSRYPNAQTAKVDRYGLGPALQGAFTQSNLGIVSRLTLWLIPTPEFFRSYTFRFQDRHCLPTVTEAIRPLMLSGVIDPYCYGIWNSYKYAAVVSQFPWKLTQGKTPLSIAELDGKEPWYGGGAIYAASEAIGRARIDLLQSQLGDSVEDFFEWEPRAENRVYFGEPTSANIRSMYWRKQSPPPEQMNPDEDRCGVMWLCIGSPLVGSAVDRVLEVAGCTLGEHGFEPNLGGVAPTGREMHVFAALLYDRDVAGQDALAQQCHDAVWARLAEQGFYPYRLGINGMAQLADASNGFQRLAGRLKRALDPHDTLAPGRYTPRR